jgi:hypothetical protein
MVLVVFGGFMLFLLALVVLVVFGTPYHFF